MLNNSFVSTRRPIIYATMLCCVFPPCKILTDIRTFHSLLCSSLPSKTKWVPSPDLIVGNDLTPTQPFPGAENMIACGSRHRETVFHLKEYNTMFMHERLYWVFSVSVPPEIAPDVDGICLMIYSLL